MGDGSPGPTSRGSTARLHRGVVLVPSTGWPTRTLHINSQSDCETGFLSGNCPDTKSLPLRWVSSRIPASVGYSQSGPREICNVHVLVHVGGRTYLGHALRPSCSFPMIKHGTTFFMALWTKNALEFSSILASPPSMHSQARFLMEDLFI